MKKLYLLLFSALLLSSLSKAQPGTVREYRQGTKVVSLTEKTIVKDTSGKIYAVKEWQKLVISRDYVIKPVGKLTNNSQFVLYAINKEQRDSLINKMPKPPESVYFKTGESITPLIIYTEEGKKIKLSELKGKIVVVDFWTMYAHTPLIINDLNRLVSNYKDNPGVKFIAFGINHGKDVSTFLKENPLHLEVIPDAFFIGNPIQTFPTFLVLDKDGIIRFHTSGYQANTVYWIKKTIDELK